MVEVASLRHLDVSTIGPITRGVICYHFRVIAAQAVIHYKRVICWISQRPIREMMKGIAGLI